MLPRLTLASMRRFLPMCSLVALAGCAPLPDRDCCLAPLSAPAMDRTLSDAWASPVFSTGEWPSSDWWTVYGDEQLNSLIEAGLAANPSLQVASSRFQEALEVALATRSSLYPRLDFEATDQWIYESEYGELRGLFEGAPASYNITDLTFQLSYDLDLFGKNQHRFLAALSDAQARVAEEAQARLKLSAAIATAYFDIQMQTRIGALLSLEMEELRKLSGLALARFVEGLRPEDAFLQADRKSAALEARLTEVENQKSLAQHLLCALLALGPDDPRAELQDAGASLQTPIALPRNLPLELLSRRPDIAQQLYLMEAACERIEVAKASFYPNVNLIALGGLESVHFSKLFSLASKTGTLEPAITLPLFNAGQLRAEYRAAYALYEEAIATYNETVLRAVQQVADAIAQLQSLERVLASLQEQARTLQLQRDLALGRERAGLSPQDESSSLTISLLEVDVELRMTEQKRALAQIQLFQALGGGYELHAKEACL